MARFDGDPDPATFDFKAAAELFPARHRKPGLKPFGYRRFADAAEAVRFAIEELPADVLKGGFLQVDDARFDSGGIRRLYERAEFPLARRAAAETP